MNKKFKIKHSPVFRDFFYAATGAEISISFSQNTRKFSLHMAYEDNEDKKDNYTIRLSDVLLRKLGFSHQPELGFAPHRWEVAATTWIAQSVLNLFYAQQFCYVLLSFVSTQYVEGTFLPLLKIVSFTPRAGGINKDLQYGLPHYATWNASGDREYKKMTTKYIPKSFYITLLNERRQPIHFHNLKELPIKINLHIKMNRILAWT